MEQDEHGSRNKHQWRENAKNANRSAALGMTRQRLEEIRRDFVASYGCASNEITWRYVPIEDKNDPDRFDHVKLIFEYTHVRGCDGVTVTRCIYEVKVPVPNNDAVNIKKRQYTATKADDDEIGINVTVPPPGGQTNGVTGQKRRMR